MKSCLIALLVLTAQLAAQQSAPQIPFQSVPDFFKMPPGMNFGEVAGVATNSQGHVFVFHRVAIGGPAFGPTAAMMHEFGPNGEFIREVAPNLYAWAFAHSVRIDRNDNIWGIDKGSDMIVKLTPAGRVVWVFGRRKESADGAEPWEHPDPPAAPQDGRFRQPTDVAWDSQGNIYITDGYVNSRVAKYDKNGDWAMQWGSKGTGDGQFNTPHSIAIDKNDNVYVGDRGNRRVQVFDTNGKFLRKFAVEVPPDFTTRAVNGATPTSGMNGVGAPNSLCIANAANNTQVLFLGESTWPGRIFKLGLDGKVLGVIGRSGRNMGQFSGAHALACPSENELFVGETSNWRVQKLILRPPQP
ncbi:MAG: 6-bladed beta-propeller [Gemmatimonadetes bacterium]|nr:6-bladed beta-propeller [Gemmatimonadota bacterium]